MFKIFHIGCLLLFFLSSAQASPLSFSARLVNSDGSPTAGPVDLRFELAYSDDTSLIQCSKDLEDVGLSSGVFHANLNFAASDCGARELMEVLEQTPSGESVMMRVSDRTDTGNIKTYPFQALNSVPMSVMSELSEMLVQMGASDGQVLKWDGSKWAPGSDDGEEGTVTQINTGTGLTGGPITGSGTISLADDGVTSAKIDDGTIQNADIGDGQIQYIKLSINDGDIPNAKVDGLGSAALADIGVNAGMVMGADAVPSCAADEKLQMSLGPTYSWTCADDSTATDNTKLPLAGGTMQGGINMDGNVIENLPAPNLDGDAATKKYVDDETHWDLSGSDVYYSGGNVGVGKSNPSHPLDIAGVVSADSYIASHGGLGGFVTYDRDDDSKFTTLYSESNAFHIFRNSQNRLTVGNTGNVGIGTSSPSAKLEVAGQVKITGGTPGSGKVLSSDASGLASWVDLPSSNTPSGSASGELTGNYPGPQIASGVIDDDNVASGANINSSKLGTGVVDNTEFNYLDGVTSSLQTQINNKADASSLADYVLKAGDTMSGPLNLPSNGLNVGSGQLVASGGRVGVGTASPLSALHVVGAGGVSIKGNSTSSSIKSVDTINNSGGQEDDLLISASGGVLVQLDENANSTGVSKGFEIFDRNQNSLLLVDESNGNVGVGTSSPGAKLDIKGSVSAGDPLANSGVMKLNADNFAWYGWYLGGSRTAFIQSQASSFDIYSQTSGVPMRFVTSSSERMRIDGTGNVGIGTTSPGAKLEVAGQVKITGGSPGAGKVLSSDASGLASWVDLPSSNTPSGSASGELTGNYPGPEIASGVIDDDNVAGSANISASKLGTGVVDNTEFNYLDNVTSPLQAQIDDKADASSLSNYVLKTGDAMTGPLVLPSNGLEVGASELVVDGGNVGIGTSTPSQKLEVEGTVQADRVRFDTSNFYIDNAGSTGLGVRNNDNKLHAVFRNIGGGAPYDSTLWLGTYNSFNYPNFSFIDDTNTGIAGGKVADTLYFVTGGSAQMTLDGSGNIGVGTTTPAYKLDVNSGSIGLDTDQSIGNDNSRVQFGDTTNYVQNTIVYKSGVTSSGAEGHVFKSVDSSNNSAKRFVIESGIDNPEVMFFTGASGSENNTMTLTGAGNVGVGTSSPSAKLEVDGQVKINGGIPGNGKVLTSDANGLASWMDLPSSGAPSGTASGELAGSYPNPTVADGVIDDANIAGGANINASKLGTGVVDNTEFNYLNGVTSPLQAQIDAKVSDSISNGVTNVAPSQNAVFDALATKADASNLADYVLKAGDTMTGTLALPTDGLEVGGSQFVIDGGNVGVGTASPTSEFQIGSTSGIGARLYYDGTASGASSSLKLSSNNNHAVMTLSSGGGSGDTSFLRFQRGSNNYIQLRGPLNSNPVANRTITLPDADGEIALTSTVDSNYVKKAGDTMTGVLNLPSNGLNVGTNELAVSGGNVGIGTNSPAAKLNIAGKTLINGGDTSGLSDGYLKVDRVGNYGDEIGILLRMDGDGDANSNGVFDTGADDIAIELQSDAGGDPAAATTKYRLWSDGSAFFNGNIGVGTTTPGAKLEVAGQVKITGGSPGNGKVLTSDANGLASWQAPASGGVTDVTASAPLSSTGGVTPNISLPQASSSSDGYLSSGDWSLFNGKLSTSLASSRIFVGNSSGQAAAVNVSGDATLSNTGVLNLTTNAVATGNIQNTAVTDAKINSVSGSKVTGDIPGDAAGFNGSLAGDVSGTQGATSVNGIRGRNVANSAPATNQALVWNGSQWVPDYIPPTSSSVGSLSTLNFSSVNTLYTSASCGASSLVNLETGGTYSLIVESSSGICTFSSSGRTVRLPYGQTSVTISSPTVFTFIVTPSSVYVSWVNY